jgi:hypothetical protein
MIDDVGASGREAVASPSRPSGTRLPADALISPELALVDPDLAARMQAALPDGEDTVELLLRAARDRGRAAIEEVSVTRSRPRISRKRLVQAGLAGAGLAAIAVALAFEVRVEFRERDAAADSAIGRPPEAPAETLAPRPTAPAVRKPSTQRSAKQAAASRARATPKRTKAAGKSVVPGPLPQTRRFAWAPVPRAASYHVEFFRGSTRVFSASTRRAEIAIPRRWRFRGRAQSLEPGEYRWYVWPVFPGSGRAAAASVQARLSVG